jgi:phenylacetate-CoA ligase
MGKIKFGWSEELVGKRHGVYPNEEGDRTKAHSEKHWSAIETLPRDRIKEIQWVKLQNLIRFAYENSPFYRKKWNEVGVKPKDIKSWDDIYRIPIVTKHDFGRDQEEHPPYGSAYTSPPSTQLKFWMTSGTTRKPRLWCETKEDWENGTYLYMRGLYAHGIRPGWRGFFGFSYPPFIAFWLAHHACEWIGCQVVPRGPIPTVTWLQMMQNLANEGVDSWTAGTPTYTMRMIEVAEQAKIDLKELNVKVLHMAGEPGASVPSTKKYLEEAWGAKAHDMLGSVEVSGPVLYSCAEQAENEQVSDHISEDYYIVELVDPKTLEPVEKGKPGLTVITALGRFGMPAIRFLQGDWLEISEERCRCGRSFILAKGAVKSRGDDMIIVKGVNIYPSLIEDSVRSIDGLSPEYRIKVTSTGKAIILVEPKSDVPQSEYDNLIKRLQEDIRSKTTVRMDISMEKPGSLPRDEVKSKRIIRE